MIYLSASWVDPTICLQDDLGRYGDGLPTGENTNCKIKDDADRTGESRETECLTIYVLYLSWGSNVLLCFMIVALTMVLQDGRGTMSNLPKQLMDLG